MNSIKRCHSWQILSRHTYMSVVVPYIHFLRIQRSPSSLSSHAGYKLCPLNPLSLGLILFSASCFSLPLEVFSSFLPVKVPSFYSFVNIRDYDSDTSKNRWNCNTFDPFQGTCSGAVGWGNALQHERLRVRFSTISLKFFIDIILPAALWRCGWLSF
jgi:hypothetical protein